MSTTTPAPSKSPQTTTPSPHSSFSRPNAGPSLVTLNKIAWGGAILCPALILAPPRKLDIFTLALVISTAICANHIQEQRTGLGILDGGAKWYKEREARMARKELGGEKERGVLQRLWWGNEGKDWVEKRRREEEVALREGKGYSGIIADTVWEVWSGGKEEEERARREKEKVYKGWEEERRRVREAQEKETERREKGETEEEAS